MRDRSRPAVCNPPGTVMISELTRSRPAAHSWHDAEAPARRSDGRITPRGPAHDTGEQQRTIEALRRANIKLEHEAARVAGVLHDEASQLLVSTHLAVTDLLHRAPPSLAMELRAIGAAIGQIGAQLRRLSHELHPGVLEALGFADAVEFLADEFARDTGIRVCVDAVVEPDWPAEIQSVLYRFVQEAFDNIRNHAHPASVRIVVRREAGAFRCSIEDDGEACDSSPEAVHAGSGFGLAVVKDRLAAAGGTLRIRSSPGHGTELRAIVPDERLSPRA